MEAESDAPGRGHAAVPCGRPEPGEYADYARPDIDRVTGDDIVLALQAQMQRTLGLLTPIDERRAATLTYAVGKWTLKEVVGHLSDDERIFAYRILCIARNDPRPLPGFDEKEYARSADFVALSFAALLEGYRIVRESTIVLLRGLSPAAWMRRGRVNSYSATVRGLAYHIAGHELHHLDTVRREYLLI